MQIIYIPDEVYTAVVKLNQATMVNMEGHIRWVVNEQDGAGAYMLRPTSAMDNANVIDAIAEESNEPVLTQEDAQETETKSE